MPFVLALLYLALCFWFGAVLLRWVFPPRKTWDAAFSTRAAAARPSWARVHLAAAFLVGMLGMGWLSYLSTLLFSKTASPLAYGNGLACGLVLLGLAVTWKPLAKTRGEWVTALRAAWPGKRWQDYGFSVVAFLLCLFVTAYTVRTETNELVVGGAAASEVGSQLSLARSFSQGSNFPAQYTAFADAKMRFDFFFAFFAGNLESLGLPLAWAFNVPSVLCLFFLIWLMGEVAVLLTADRRVAWLGWTFFLLPPTLSSAPYLGLQALASRRPLTFGLGVLFVILASAIVQWFPTKGRKKKNEAFPWPAVAQGLLIGLLGYWSGAVALSAVGIFLGLAYFSRKPWAMVGSAALGAGLMLLETKAFTGAFDTLVLWRPGSLASDGAGVFSYFWTHLGALPVVVAAGLYWYTPKMRAWAIAFAIPLVAAFTLGGTRDLEASHKFLLIAALFFNLIVGAVLVRLTPRAAVALGLLLTFMSPVGLYQWVRGNAPSTAARTALENPLSNWIREKTPPQSVFLIPQESSGLVALTGRSLYLSDEKGATSSGYPVETRQKIIEKILSAPNGKDMDYYLRSHGLDFIVATKSTPKQRRALMEGSLTMVYEDVDLGIQVYKASSSARNLASLQAMPAGRYKVKGSPPGQNKAAGCGIK